MKDIIIKTYNSQHSHQNTLLSFKVQRIVSMKGYRYT